jgi:outer membrane protein OmpA-like peptidoglycan-associated protein
MSKYQSKMSYLWGHLLFSLFSLLFSLLFVAGVTSSAFAQEAEWYEQFFLEAAGQYYFTPGFFSELVKPDMGFRGALGYEYRRFRLAVESGYTHITGTNPLALDFRFVPLTIKAGYALPLSKGFGVQADMGFGWIFSQTVHYETAIDMLQDNIKESSATSTSLGARLYGTYSFLHRKGGIDSLKLYAGGGIDMIFEDDGTIPLPMFEAGVSFKPLALFRPKGKEVPAAVIETPAEEVPEVAAEETEIRAERVLTMVYFEADTAVMIERYRNVLDEAGERLRADPNLKITLRGYTAPFGWLEGRKIISADRVRFCAEYLKTHYGIDEGRMKIEYFGSERAPESANADWQSYRCVELIIETENREQRTENSEQ